VQVKDTNDFRQARVKEMRRALWALISGKKRDLLSWDEVSDKLKLRGGAVRGTQVVPISKIVGSVGRYRDFDDAFLPMHNHLLDRWSRLNRAYYDLVHLPPVQLYKVGDVYFVVDGNHRISVAREHGVEFVDAEVIEVHSRVPITGDLLDADSLEMLGEYAEFLERTHLDVLRPDQNIIFSSAGGYHTLIEHIAMHRYFMGIDLKRDISEDEAVTDWYDNVYMPIVKAIRENDVLKDFPKRTEADLYLWIVAHEYEIERETQQDISADEAVQSYVEKRNEEPTSPLKRIQQTADSVWGAVGDLINK
jgi:hypothetical protein